ncbi:TonB-dependent siderophore receptor [Pseudomonas syringae]|uniref:TonB-dependent siderophore receptor n=4 Tax=Pseudomonas syringae group TaxID=136849 RepID=UPI0034D7AED6
MSHSKDRLSHKSRQTLLSVSIAACAAISLQITPQAFAAEQQYTIAVDSTPLGQALLAIARQSGKVIAFDPALVDSLKAKPITATMTIEQALDAVLIDTGLTFTRTPNGSYTIIQGTPGGLSNAAQSSQQDASKLNTLTVWAQRQELGYAADSASAATRTNTSLLELPRSVGVVSRELMDDRQVTSVADALSNVAGVTVNKANDGATPLSINIRGFDVENAMTDGMMSSGIYAFNTPTIALDKIEVIKGPEGITGGMAAKFGGTVNMVSKKPLPYARREALVELDSNSKRQIGIDVTGPLTEDKRLRGRLIGMTEEGADTDLGWNGGDTHYLSPQLAWEDELNKVLIGAELKNETRPYGNYVYSTSGKLSKQSPITPHAKDDHGEYNSRRYYLDVNRYLGDDWEAKFRGQYADQKGRVKTYSTGPVLDFPGIPAGTPGFPANGIAAGDYVTASPMDVQFDTSSTTLQGSLSKALSIGPTEHDLLMGYDYFETESLTQLYMDLVTPPAFIPVGQTALLQSLDDQSLSPLLGDGQTSRSRETGYFIQDQASFGDLNILASARRVSFRNLGDTGAEPLDKWLYGLGINYRLTPGVSVYGSYSEGTSNAFNYLTVDGSSLVPTESEQYEVGAKFAFDDQRFIITTALFRIDERNVPMQDPLNPQFFRSEAGLQSEGLEIEARGRLTPNLNVSLAYTNMRSTNMEDEGLPTGKPRQHVNMWASYQLSGGWSVGGGIDARSTIEARGLTREQPINAPGQARLDAMVRYDAKTWSSVLGVRNIANRRLYGDVINPVATYVEPERTFTLTTTVKF